MDYFKKYKKYKNKFIEIKNLYGGFNEYQTLKSNVLDDFFYKLYYNIYLFISEYQQYNLKNSNYKYHIYLELNELGIFFNFINNIDIDKSTINELINELINILNKNYYLNLSYFQTHFDIDLEQTLSDTDINIELIKYILNTINYIIKKDIPYEEVLSLKKKYFLQYISNYIIEIENLKIQLDINSLNIKYKEQIIKINIDYINFYKSFTLLCNFIITHTIYCMHHIYYNINLTLHISIPYIEDYKLNDTITTHSHIARRSLSKDLLIENIVTLPTFQNSYKIINDLYKKLFDNKNLRTFNSRISKNKEFFIESNKNQNDHFTWHTGESKNYIGNTHYRSVSTATDYKLFFLLDSENTRTFCFKSVKYNNDLPIYNINDFEYLLFIIYYLKYSFCMEKKMDIYNLSKKYIWFDINKINIEQYQLFFI